MLTLRHNVHHHATRNRLDIATNHMRTKKAHMGTADRSYRLFNSLPVSVKSLPMRQFKQCLKKALLNKACYSMAEAEEALAEM